MAVYKPELAAVCIPEQEVEVVFGTLEDVLWLVVGVHRGCLSYLGDFADEPELGVELEHTWQRIDFSLWYGRGLEDRGNYAEANVSRAFHFNELISIVPSVQLGFASGYADLGSGLTHFGVRIDFPLDFTDNISLVPYIAMNLPLDALRSVGLSEDTFYAGIALRCRF